MGALDVLVGAMLAMLGVVGVLCLAFVVEEVMRLADWVRRWRR